MESRCLVMLLTWLVGASALGCTLLVDPSEANSACNKDTDCAGGQVCRSPHCVPWNEASEGEGEGSEGEGQEIVWIALPGGTFQMGSATASNEQPVHPVTIPGFEVMKTEVTVGMIQTCRAGGGCSNEPDTGGSCNWGVAGRELHPVNCIDWDQARDFAAWVGEGARLCSEAEWEYVARSGDHVRTYPWGDQAATCGHAVYSDCNCNGGTCPVCDKTDGDSAQGVCDLAGNVGEWVEDWWHDTYVDAPSNGSAWVSPAGSSRVRRGGSWSVGADLLRASYRGVDTPDYRGVYLGARLCR
ncbi:MAG: formylglycine-generating enzyme family protein [Myxococcota bacterium]|nr:formylglycine-generating enzyme family protein [Myxococcota bacterium]